jgi:hypothetical protein
LEPGNNEEIRLVGLDDRFVVGNKGAKYDK